MTSHTSPIPPATERPRLRRDTDEKMIGGVAAGIARHFDLDVSLVRLAFAALAIFGGSGLVLYLVAWLVVPADETVVAAPVPAPITTEPPSAEPSPDTEATG